MREFLAETGPEFSARVRGQAGFASEYTFQRARLQKFRVQREKYSDNSNAAP